jgi:mono/diheme cytochrome c family protein
MTQKRRYPSFSISVALLIACPLTLAQDPGGDAETGKKLYLDFACYSCHGYNATGRTPLNAKTSGILSSDTLFLTYLRLRADQNPVNPKNTMPNYSANTLSDAQALDIYAYLVSLNDELPASVEDVDVMRQILEAAEKRTDVDANE